MTAKPRKGIATTELALCLPIVIFITLAVIETTSFFHLKESATLAAYEGARIGIRKQGTDEQVESKVVAFLESRNINFGNDFLSISTPGFDSADALEHVTVTVTLPCTGNIVTNLIFGGREVAGQVTMRKEFRNL